jgi:hypothetical protein
MILRIEYRALFSKDEDIKVDKVRSLNNCDRNKEGAVRETG